MSDMQPEHLTISELGPRSFPSPLRTNDPGRAEQRTIVEDTQRIRYSVETNVPPELDRLTFEVAGPRSAVYFDPAKTTAAIVTCGGLSPGLNNVIRSAVSELLHNYGVARVLGIRRGYLGLNPESRMEPLTLDDRTVADIDKLGGTVLGSSRGPQDPTVMADFLAGRGIDILLCLGGDGTQRGAFAIHQELQRRGRHVAIVGIPKTIDNDVPFVDVSFGYATALEKAAEVIRSAHVEARGVYNGIGLVKLMGRYAGFIAAGATVVSQEVNFTLVPEVPFPLEGESGLLAALEERLRRREHAVVVVAEGAGQDLIPGEETKRDASGNVGLQDIGAFLRHRISDHFASRGMPIALKYLDPSYHIRSVPANAYDRFLCDHLARHAVHAAMAGKTGMLIGYQHNRFVHIPIPTVVNAHKRLEPNGQLWQAVLQVTGQPNW